MIQILQKAQKVTQMTVLFNLKEKQKERKGRTKGGSSQFDDDSKQTNVLFEGVFFFFSRAQRFRSGDDRSPPPLES